MRISLLSVLAFAIAFAPQVQAQDIAAPPTFGDVRLDGGFMPDPHTVDLVAGGSISVDVPGCSYGHVASAPDVDFYYEGSGTRTLYIYAISDSDTTLLINRADGSWLCDDDGFGDGDPIVVIPNARSGLYNIWVGTYGTDTAPATLYISEIDPR